MIWHTIPIHVFAAGKNQIFVDIFIDSIHTPCMKRVGKKHKGKLLSIWVSETLLPRLDEGVKREDSDRSKFIRNAVREKLSRHGAAVKK
ncbi:MAG: ribbon-helix-helix domain-containing protein [Verrucomicrobiota bacterium]